MQKRWKSRQTNETKPGAVSGTSSLTQLLDTPEDSRMDIAAANLLSASELPGAGILDVDRYLQWLDEAAHQVQVATEQNYYKFIDDPAAYDFSQARFCMICLVTVLQQKCGVHYNPKWKGLTPDRPIPESFGVDASDVFIHAIIDGIGGTCGSLPVLYAAIGRRLGYPLKIVKAARHLFVRWDDPEGKHWFHAERFNIEATGPGIHFLPDEHYKRWPHPIADEDIEAGVFLRSLSPREELAEFVATRGYCLARNRRVDEAIAALTEASKLSPLNRHFAASVKAMRMHQMLRRRGHAFLNAPVVGNPQQPVGPFWMDGRGGQKMLVQIVSPVQQSFTHEPTGFGPRLTRTDVQTPNGLRVEAWVPVHEVGTAMTAHWVQLPDGRHALVHKPPVRTLQWQDSTQWNEHRIGQPIIPELAHQTHPFHWSTNAHANVEQLPSHEQSLLASRIHQQAIEIQNESPECPPELPLLAIPAGPAAPRLPHSGKTSLFLT